MSHNWIDIDHIEAMRGRLPHHMAVAENFDALMAASAAGFQQLETALLDLQLLRTIDTATGVQLDGIGEIIDLPRIVGQTDDSYRFSLKTAMIILTKSGEPESIIEAYLNVTGSVVVEYTEIYPATFQIAALPTVDITDPDVAAFINNTMASVKPARVRLRIQDGAGTEIAAQSFTPTASWQRFQIAGTFGASPAANIQVFIDPVNDTGSAGDSLQMWGAMLYETTNTDLNMLISGSEFDNAAWLKTNATVTANAVADPYNGAGGGLARVI